MATTPTPLQMALLDVDQIPDRINGSKVLSVAKIDVDNRSARGCWGAFGLWTLIGTSMCFPFLGCIFAPFERLNQRDVAKKTKLILTEDSLVLRIGGHLTCCRLACCGCAEGTSEKIVPLDRVTDLGVRLPGEGCCDTRCPLSTIAVQTAGSGLPVAEITVSGIIDPVEFKDLVMKTKKSLERGMNTLHDETTTYQSLKPPTSMAMTPSSTMQPITTVINDPETTQLLRDIKDILLSIQKHNQLAPSTTTTK